MKIFSIFRYNSLKGSIELCIFLLRSFYDVRKSLIQSMTYEEIRVYMDISDDEFSLANR